MPTQGFDTPVTLLGAGAWGTALAVQLAQRTPVCLWARDPAHALHMQTQRDNPVYLPGIRLPPALKITSDFEQALTHCAAGVCLIATPMAGLVDVLVRIQTTLTRGMLGTVFGKMPQVLWLCKGLQKNTAALAHEVAQQVAPMLQVGVVSGPSFALEVARGQPTALVAASTDASVCNAAVAALHGGALRLYTSSDPTGVEVGGAVKNVMAIAAGIADGYNTHGLGTNARAALITRGLAEMTRLGLALGARPETFMGLSGLGDLVLTTTGNLSRNRQVGLQLAQGLPLPQILADLGHVAEGVHSAPMVLKRAHASGVEMPITEAVVRLLEGEQTVAQAIEMLMERRTRPEYYTHAT